MSAATLQGIEDAIRAHLQAGFDEDTNEERRGAVIINWVVGLTLSNVVDVDGRPVVGYHNEHIAPSGDPNAGANLAAWVSADIDSVLSHDDE